MSSATTALQQKINQSAAQKTVAKEQALIEQTTDPIAKSYLQAKLKLYQWQNGLISGPQPVDPQAQANYTAFINSANQRDQRVVSTYNQHLMTQLQQYGKQYDAAVSGDNIAVAQQARTPTQLLQYNVQQAYNTNKAVYHALSNQLPTGQSSGNTTQNGTTPPPTVSTGSK